MEKLFGIPMNSIMIVMLTLLSFCLLTVAFIAWRRPVIFKLGIRNIPRRKTQTSLIVVGLMLATLIMSAALATGDTTNASVNTVAYDLLGPIDELVVVSHDGSGEGSAQAVYRETMPVGNVEIVRAALADAEVDAVGGVVLTMAPVLNLGDTPVSPGMPDEAILQSATASNPTVSIAATSQDFIDAVGGMVDVDGVAVDVSTLGADEVYVSAETADDLGLAPGDHVAYFLDNEPYGATVRGIIPDTLLAGGTQPNQPSMLVGLEHLQSATGNEGRISGIFISNTGGVSEGLTHSDAVSRVLEAELGGRDMGVVPIKQQNAEAAELNASMFVTMFVVFGLFSIAVGILLIVLIFTMLAAERRAEMGMERAVGAQRRQLIQQFIAEGAGYTLVSGLIGTTLGVGAAWVIAQGLGDGAGIVGLEFNVHPRSMVIAYSLGVVITFLAVILSSWRVSKLNVVAAIRDIPEVYRAKRNRRQLLWGTVGIIAGVALTLLGWTEGAVTPFLVGVTVVPFGIAAILTYLGVASRLVLTIVGAFVLAWWLLPNETFERVFGDDRFGAGGMELFLLSGLSIVAGSTIIIIQNLELLLGLIRRVGGRFRGMIASVRVGISYPEASAGRTGMTIAMFALIVFSIVVMGSINNTFSQVLMSDDLNAGMQVRVDVPMSNPIDDFTVALDEAGIARTEVGAPGRVDAAGSLLDQQLVLGEEGEETWETGLVVESVDATYLDETQLRFSARAEGYDSDEAIRTALKTEPNVVVIPSSVATADDATADQDFGGGAAITFDAVPSEGTFAPYAFQMRGGSGEPMTLRVIGVLDPDYFMMVTYFIGAPTMDQLLPADEPRFSSYYLSVADGVDPGEVASRIEAALLRYGVQAVNIEQEMLEGREQQDAFMLAMQGFMGLGMIVGVAAVGVISYRAVVERRQQIGMLRALGFQTSTVASAFVIETAVVVILGTVSGAVMGLILSRNLMNDPAWTGGVDSVEFAVPWPTVLTTVGVAIAAALVMSWFPARQASHTLPAEALRYE